MRPRLGGEDQAGACPYALDLFGPAFLETWRLGGFLQLGAPICHFTSSRGVGLAVLGQQNAGWAGSCLSGLPATAPAELISQGRNV
jgi:hypothetical protein